jgi:RimJ/RimL family protein N-acetyltransferase
VTPEVRTDRLVLRGWRPEDRAPFAALNRDPAVMEHLPGLLDREASDAMADRFAAEWTDRGYGLWAVEVPGVAPFVGFVGLHHAAFAAPFTPAVEVGWRLARPAWGHGYATEAARAALAHGFDTVRLDEIVSFTTPANTRSRAVMERIGLTRDPADDFEHPLLPVGNRLRPHVLYRLDRDTWASTRP